MLRNKQFYAFEDLELELPISVNWEDEFRVDRVGEHIVLSYLVHDDSPENPMKECYANGELLTYREGVITDDNGAASHLGLIDFEPTYNIDHEGVDEQAREIMWQELEFDIDFQLWCHANYEIEEHEDHRQFYRQCLLAIDFDYDSEVESWLDHRYVLACEKAWNELWEQGRIGDYLAVPVNYCDSVHGPGTTRIGTADLDFANAVWVPCKDAIENIKSTVLPAGYEIRHEWIGKPHMVYGLWDKGERVDWYDTYAQAVSTAWVRVDRQPTHAELMQRARSYADAVLNEYESWCNGDCWGIVNAVFDETGGLISEDSCWGYIGREYAEEELDSGHRSLMKSVGARHAA